jgi:hypothetical protein
MKHIGWCLDQIQIAFFHLPRTIDDPKDKVKANKVLDEVEEYAHTMMELVLSDKLRVHLNKLKEMIAAMRILHFKDPESSAKVALVVKGLQTEEEVEELLKDLKHMLYITELYVTELRDLIRSHSGSWWYKTKQFCVAIKHMVDDDKRKLSRDYKFTVRFKSKVKSLQHQFSNKADRLAETIHEKFGGERADLRKEFKLEMFTIKELKEIVSSEKHLAELLK